MDIVTHVLAGACVAQIPRQLTKTNANQKLSFYQCAMIGAVAVAFPDIDYMLFLWNPLEFLAYWHRAETHSLVLAPLWSLKESYKPHRQLIFWISLLALLSHSMIDSLTIYGIQWFAPFSDISINWNLLFVIDVYFTVCLVITFLCLHLKQNQKAAHFMFLLPICYLLFVMQIKTQAEQNILLNNKDNGSSIALLPQPFSPFHWNVIIKNDENLTQAYLKLINDPLSGIKSSIIGKKRYQSNYQSSEYLLWNNYSLVPENQQLQSDAITVWNHDSFKAFRDFAIYPVFYKHTKVGDDSCIWFSDLRYHWPEFIPSFRYGMCSLDLKNGGRVYRLKYFSEKRDKVGA